MSPPVPEAVVRGRILLIDDTPLNLRLLIALLQDDYELVFATDGARGLERARAEPLPDLILCDVSMPGMDGHEVCRRLKDDDRTRNIPLIFVTANDSEAAEAYGINLGAVDYITRPISGPILRARVRTHVNARRQGLVYEQLATIDGLTGLSNRRRFDQALRQEWDRAQRDGSPVALLFADIDHFKRYNDTYGHGAGDEVLRQVSRQVLPLLRRPGDLAARYGGEELVVLLPGTPIEGAVQLAEDFRQAVERLGASYGGLSISIGCHSQVPMVGTGPDTLVERADAELYRAKRNGRNRVCWQGRPGDA